MAEFDKFRLGSELETDLDQPLSSYEEYLLIDELWETFGKIVGFDFVQTAEPGFCETVRVRLGDDPASAALARVKARCFSEQINTRRGVEDIVKSVCTVRYEAPTKKALFGEAGQLLRLWQRSEFYIDAGTVNPFLYTVSPTLRTHRKQKFVVAESSEELDFLADAEYESRDYLKRGDRIFLQGLMGVIEEKYTDAIDLG